jgi:hypothetical protein
VKLVGLMRQHLGWIPGEMDAQKKVYWSVLLLDTLQGMTCKRVGPLLCFPLVLYGA